MQVTNISNVTEALRRLRCELCKTGPEDGTVAVVCEAPDCGVAFHPLCGRRYNRELNRNSKDKPYRLDMCHFPAGDAPRGSKHGSDSVGSMTVPLLFRADATPAERQSRKSEHLTPAEAGDDAMV